VDRASGGPEIGPAPEARLPQAGSHTRCAACLVVRQGPLPRPVFLVDVFTGQRERWGSFDSPVDRGGWLNNHFITPDGRTMAANIYRRQSTLFVLEGLK